MALRGGAKLVVCGLLGCCVGISSSGFAQQSEKPSTADSPKTPYAVEDLILGDNVDPDTVTSRTYHCSPSEQFTGFTWCTSKSSKGRVHATYSILHSPDDKIVYANKTLEPAFSSSTEAKEELQRISQKIGTQPKIINMPHRPELPDGSIAVWGDVVLTPVDAGNVRQLADGKNPKLGFMVDFITDFQRSAKSSLPIYRVGGGAGLVLAVSYGKPDQGTLRLIAVDASQFSSPLTEQDQQGPVAAQPSPAADQAPVVAQPSPNTRQTAIAAQPSTSPGQTTNGAQRSPTLNQTANVAQLSAQPIDKESESQTNLTELKHTISLLKADLASATAKIAKLEIQNGETERQLKQEAQARLSAEAAKNQIEQTMLENQIRSRNSKTGLWTVLAMIFGGLITLLAIRAPTASNRWDKWNLSRKVSNVNQWTGQFERKISTLLVGIAKGRTGHESVNHVAETNVTTQPS